MPAQNNTKISGESIVTVTQSQVSCEVNGETVILHFDSGNYFGLNDVGTLVWKMVQQPRSVRDLREALLREYEVDADRCQSDLDILLEELQKHGLVEVRNPAA